MSHTTANESRFQAALADERKELDSMPATHERYRRDVLAAFKADIQVALESWENDKYTGYRYAPEVIEALWEHFEEICNLLESGRTIFNPKARQARINQLKARSASANPGLRSFLEAMVPPDA